LRAFVRKPRTVAAAGVSRPDADPLTAPEVGCGC
jgi:hypothetical protein